MAFKDRKSKDRVASRWEWPIRDLEAEEVDRSLGMDTRRDWVRETVRGRGGRLTPEQKRDIDDEGYHAGWSMSVASWHCPYREGTQQHDIWKAGWREGRDDRERQRRNGLDD